MYYFHIVYQRYIILCDICQNIVWTYITEEIYRKHNIVLFNFDSLSYFFSWNWIICKKPAVFSILPSINLMTIFQRSFITIATYTFYLRKYIYIYIIILSAVTTLKSHRTSSTRPHTAQASSSPRSQIKQTLASPRTQSESYNLFDDLLRVTPISPGYKFKLYKHEVFRVYIYICIYRMQVLSETLCI